MKLEEIHGKAFTSARNRVLEKYPNRNPNKAFTAKMVQLQADYYREELAKNAQRRKRPSGK